MAVDGPWNTPGSKKQPEVVSSKTVGPDGFTLDGLISEFEQGRVTFNRLGLAPACLSALKELRDRRAVETECKQCAQHEKDMERELEARDANADYADQLTAMIGVYFETDHGEHTSGNFPWENAIETMRVAIGTKQSPEKPCTRCGGAGTIRDPETWMGGPCPECSPVKSSCEPFLTEAPAGTGPLVDAARLESNPAAPESPSESASHYPDSVAGAAGPIRRTPQ